MKRKDRNLLLAGGAAAGGYYLYKKKKEGTTVSGLPSVAGPMPAIAGGPHIGAMVPQKSWVPESLRGKCSPLALDVALWGSVGALGYHLLAPGGKRRRGRR